MAKIPTASEVVKLAISQIGVCESPANSNMQKYGKAYGDNGEFWCAQFVWWLGWKASGKNQELNPIGKNASAAYIQEATVAKGGKWIMKQTRSKATRKKYLAKVKPGDIVSFDFGMMDAWRDHVGIVEKVDGDCIICIEGNTSKTGSQSNGGMVCRQKRPYYYICSAVRPKYASEKKSKRPKAGDKCLDLSNHQGKLSKKYFTKQKKKGYTSVILRSSYTTGAAFKMYEDAAFANNIVNAYNAGLNIGIYHFSQALNAKEAKKEALFCLKIIKPYRKYINLPVAYDYEWYGRLSKDHMEANGRKLNTTICSAFCETVKAEGFDTMVYASLTVFNNYLSKDIHKIYKVWVAQYFSKIEYKHDYYLWQYTSNDGKLDENVFGKQQLDSSDVVIPDAEIESGFPERGYFTIGDTGTAVKKLQRRLNVINKGTEFPALEIDGDFGKLTAKAVKFFQFIENIKTDGEVGPITMDHLDKKKWTGRRGIVNFSVSIALNNEYAYGEGERAHRVGCHICGTNTGPNKKCKERKGEPHVVKGKDGKEHTYDKTYCCNTLATAAVAHGAKDKTILSICKRGSCCGMNPKDWMVSSHIIHVGTCKKTPYSDLKMGDIIMADKNRGSERHHVLIAIGHGRYVQAGSANWSKGSISVHSGFKKLYENCYANDKGTDVCRWKG